MTTANDIDTTPTAQLDALSDGAIIVLSALVNSAEGNGFDFGFMDDAFDELSITSQQFAAYVAALDDFIEWKEYCCDDPGVQYNGIQFGLTEGAVAAQDDIAARAETIDREQAFRKIA